MSTQLHTAISDILAMPYFKNEAHKSGGSNFGHEEAVAEKIRSAGFTEISKSTYPKLTKTNLKKWAETGNDKEIRKATTGLFPQLDMPNGSFIVQPAGSQGFPDILVKDYCGRFVAVECKSGKNGECPMWNDNTPKPSTIYVLSSGKQDATTIFMGRDVITPRQQQLMDDLEKKLTEIVKQYKLLVDAEDTFNRGWIQKARKQHFQSGGGEKTNYFTHASREKCEKTALDYAKQ